MGPNGIDTLLQRMFEDALVKKDQGIHCLVLGGGSDVCGYGKVGQERFNLGFGGKEVFTGSHAMETNKPHNPIHVRSLGVNGVVVQTEYLLDLIEEFWLLTHSAAASSAFQNWGTPLRVNPEQAPAFGSECRRVDFLPSQAYKIPIMIPRDR